MSAHFRRIMPNKPKYRLWRLVKRAKMMMSKYIEQEPWRLPSRQAGFNGTDRLRLDAHSDD